jgi:predicted ATPase/DNA-binding winged helix-turn-helix (wHTH) protein
MSRWAEGFSEQALAFGPFRLIRSQKLLLENDKPVRLGSRALELLIALVERAGEVVSREELVAYVWPSTIVEETSLRVHIAALRKALGDGQGGARFITNAPGRGYCFVAPVTRPLQISSPGVAPRSPSHNLPARLTRMIGRADEVATLAALLPERRFVTIAGAGGMGKTTVALAVAEELLASYVHGVRFVDFAPIVDPLLLPSTVASVLGISVPSHDPLPALSAFLRDRNILIVLDNCEHVVEAAAVLAESLLKGAARVHVLATSREPLNAEGEWVHRLGSLETPPASGDLTAAEALTFPAIQLFVQRAMAASDSFALTDGDAPTLRDLCRQLDGMPLAIELAAARVDTLGVQGLAARLDSSLQLLTRGRRTAAPRHRTLRAMLDWSFEYLSQSEQAVLCRLATFKADFTMESAAAVASDSEVSGPEAIESVMSLATKSLLSTDAGGEVIRYRLLETTRAYALEKLVQRGQDGIAFRRHALHIQALAIRSEKDWNAMPRAQWRSTYARLIDDVRAANNWSFSSAGDPSIGIAITAFSLLEVYELGLLDESDECIDRALNHIHLLSPPQPVLEMRLNAALMFPTGQVRRQRRPPSAVVARMVELAEQLGEPRYRIEALYAVWGGAFRDADYPAAAVSAEQLSKLARSSADPAAVTLSERLLAQTRHFMGEHSAAKVLAERVLYHAPIRMPPGYISPVPRRVAMRIVLARIAWLDGRLDQAVAIADEAVEHASGHPIALTQALALAVCPIALWRGDTAARALVDQLMEHCARHPSDYWQSWPRSYDAVLTWRESMAGSPAGQDAPAPLIQTTNAMELDCIATMAAALVSADTIARVVNGAVGWCAPEILRAQGENILKQRSKDAASAAESKYSRSLALARQQGALSWAMRTATSLARLWRDQDRVSEARNLVASTYARFPEGFDTADLRAAKSLLEELDVLLKAHTT